MAVSRRRTLHSTASTGPQVPDEKRRQVEERLRARKRAALGLSPQRDSGNEAARLPRYQPPRDGPPRFMQWSVVWLLLALLLVTVGLVWRTQTAGTTSMLDFIGIRPSTAVADVPGAPIQLLVRDDFDHPRLRLAQHVEDSQWAMGFVDGVYRIRSVRPGHLSWTTLGMFDSGPYRVVTEVTISDESPWGYAGLLTRFQNEGTFYLFGVNGRGQYQVQVQENEQWQTLLPWTSSAALRMAGMPNQLSAEDDGEWLRFYANGQLLYETADLRLPTGDIGLAGGAQGQAGIEVNFDWIEIYRIRLSQRQP